MTRREQDLLSAASITTFRLNGQFLALAEELARPAGLTAAWWQVLGAVLGPPLPVAGIAREMGLTRQSVQRIADALEHDGLVAYEDNPGRRRAKLVRLTPAGTAALTQIQAAQRAWADELGRRIGARDLEEATAILTRLLESLSA